ncbi:hypothetical protein PV318_03145 [Streptomyces sp. ME02-6991-2B]|nr:hypothetical protein [Streptomyces sp. ME02-6991-2B]
MTALAVLLALLGLALVAAAALFAGLYADHRTDRPTRKHRNR